MVAPSADAWPLPQLAIVDPQHRPSVRAPYAWALGSALWWAPLTALALLLIPVASPWWFTALAAAVATGVGALAVMPLWRYRVHRWEVGPTAIYTRHGWLTQERRIAPIARVQTVDTQRGPIEQLLGLSTVTVTTASSAGKIRVSALDKAVADTLAAQLTAAVGELPDDAT